MTVLPSEVTYYGLSEDIKKAKEVEKNVVLDKLIEKALHAHEALQHPTTTTTHTSQTSTTPNVTPADATGGGKKDKKSKKTTTTSSTSSTDKDRSSTITKSASFPITITRKHTTSLSPPSETSTSTWTMPEIYTTTTLIEIKSKIWKLLPINNDRELDPLQVTIEYNHTILLESDLKTMSELGISSNSILYIVTMSAYVIRTVDNECISIPYLSPSCTVYSLRERIVQANAGMYVYVYTVLREKMHNMCKVHERVIYVHL